MMIQILIKKIYYYNGLQRKISHGNTALAVRMVLDFKILGILIIWKIEIYNGHRLIEGKIADREHNFLFSSVFRHHKLV